MISRGCSSALLRAVLFVAHAGPASWAHRPAVSGVTCGEPYSTVENALQIHDITIEWFANRVMTCEHPVFWMKYDVPQSVVGKKLYLSAGTVHPKSNPKASRFNDVRIDGMLLGPGLPTLNRGELPSYVKVPSNMNQGSIYRSPADVKNCSHSEWMRPMGVLKVYDGICTFYETFTKTYMPVILDVTPTAQQAGTHYAAVWLRGHVSGKAWFSVGIVGGKEDFMTGFPIPQGTCNCADNDDFNEQGRAVNILLIGGLGSKPVISLPEVVTCTATTKLRDYCPAVTTTTTTTMMRMTNKGGSGHHGHSGSGGSGKMSGGMSMGCGRVDGCASTKKYQSINMDMHGGMAIQFTCDVELDFVRGMIPHHFGAVDMCKVMMKEAIFVDSGLVHFCDHVRMEQVLEVGVMYQWLQQHGKSMGTRCTSMASMGCGDTSCQASLEWIAANKRMHMGMAIDFKCDSEVDFVRGMIPHHQGAVEMCKILTDYGKKDPTLTELCANITRVQRAEIYFMSEWLKKRSLALEARCSGSAAQPPWPCDDALPISESCHMLGGDGVCKCSSFTSQHACGTTADVKSRFLEVNEFCRRTCNLCPARLASHVGKATRATATSGSTSAARQVLLSAAAALVAWAVA